MGEITEYSACSNFCKNIKQTNVKCRFLTWWLNLNTKQETQFSFEKDPNGFPLIIDLSLEKTAHPKKHQRQYEFNGKKTCWN